MGTSNQTKQTKQLEENWFRLKLLTFWFCFAYYKKHYYLYQFKSVQLSHLKKDSFKLNFLLLRYWLKDLVKTKVRLFTDIQTFKGR